MSSGLSNTHRVLLTQSLVRLFKLKKPRSDIPKGIAKVVNYVSKHNINNAFEYFVSEVKWRQTPCKNHRGGEAQKELKVCG